MSGYPDDIRKPEGKKTNSLLLAKNPSPLPSFSQVPFLNEHSKRQQAETAPSLRNMNPALYRLSYPRVEKKIFSCEERGSIPRPQGNSPSRPSKTRRAPRRQTKTERRREFCEKVKKFSFSAPNPNPKLCVLCTFTRCQVELNHRPSGLQPKALPLSYNTPMLSGRSTI